MDNSIRISTWIHEIEYSDLYQHLAPLSGTQRARRVRQLMRIGLATLLEEARAPARGARGQAGANDVMSDGNSTKTENAAAARVPNPSEAFNAFGIEPQDFQFATQDKFICFSLPSPLKLWWSAKNFCFYEKRRIIVPEKRLIGSLLS